MVDELTELAFNETPTVALSALISVLSRVLVVAGEDPLNEARVAGEGVRVLVSQHLAMQRQSPSGN